MNDAPPDRTSFSPTRRLGIAASVALSVLSVVALAGMLDYLAYHYAPRFYWGASRDYQLSPLTRSALQSLTNQVRITVFFDRDHRLYPSVRALLREYSAASRRLEIDWIDYTRNLPAAQELRRRLPVLLRDEEPDLVLFESGGHTKAVAARDLRDYDTAALMRGEEEIKPVAFKGEMLFTSAINAVCEGRTRRVFFLQGHREHDLAGDAPQVGYAEWIDTLKQDNMEVAGLDLRGIDDIPADCDLLIVAGPQERLGAGELGILDRYLRRGGRMFVLFRYRAQTGLETLLADWGVGVGDSLVLDPDNTDNGILIVSRFGNHPVSRPLARSRLYLFMPRAVEPRPVANILGAPARIEPLFRTGTNGSVVTTFGSGGYRAGPDDARGEIPLAVAVERGALPGVAASLGTTRIVAVGESTFLSGPLVDWDGNRHFASAAVNWLLDRSHLLGGIQPVPIRTHRVLMSPFQLRMLRWILLVVLPGGVLAVGIVVWWRRH